MKKQFLTSLILVSSIVAINAQTWSGSSDVNGILWRNGNVGIGTTTPQEKLEILGNLFFRSATNTVNTSQGIIKFASPSYHSQWGGVEGRTTLGAVDQIQLGFYTSGNSGVPSEKMTILADGNVGIGTTNPKAGLEIFKGNTNEYALILNSSGAGWGSGMLFKNSAGTEYGIYSGGDGKWHFANNTQGRDNILIDKDGNIGIGTSVLIGTTTTDSRFKLNVEGTIRASEIQVCLQGGCDFVFKSDYKLMDLKELEQFVKTNHHLPGIFPEKEMVENGVNMKELQMKLLQKIEELTLYTIEQNKKIIELEKQNAKIQALEEKIAKLETLQNRDLTNTTNKGSLQN